MNRYFTKSDITTLKGFLGAKAAFFTGSNISEFLDSEDIVIATDKGNLLFSGQRVEDTFEGYVEEYCQFAISSCPDDVVETYEKENGIWIQPRDRQIKKISVQQETLKFFQNNVQAWEYQAHTGVLIELDSGFLYVYALSLYAEIIRIQFAETFADLVISAADDVTGDELGEHYEISRFFVPLETVDDVH